MTDDDNFVGIQFSKDLYWGMNRNFQGLNRLGELRLILKYRLLGI